MKKTQKGWKPPAGFKAVQTYVSKETYRILQSMRRYHDRSFRAELRHALDEVAKAFAAQHKVG